MQFSVDKRYDVGCGGSFDQAVNFFPEAQAYKFHIHMASFGACTAKPSYLYSQHACFQDGMLFDSGTSMIGSLGPHHIDGAVYGC